MAIDTVGGYIISFISRRPKLNLRKKDIQELESISKSRKQSHSSKGYPDKYIMNINEMVLFHCLQE